MYRRIGKLIESDGMFPVVMCSRGVQNELSPIAAFVWEMLDGNTPLKDIAHEMRYFRNVTNINRLILANEIALELQAIGLARFIEKQLDL